MSFRRYRCVTCEHVYDEALGDPIHGVAPGTRFDGLPDEWFCTLCGDPRESFEFAGLSEHAQAVAERNNDQEGDPIVIVGAGISGWYIAEQLRQNGAKGPITIVTKDDGDYYYKPHLSESVTSKSRADLIIAKGPDRAQLLDVDLRARTQVLGLDRKKKRLLTNKGKVEYGRVEYAKLVLATGAVPLRLYVRRIQRHIHQLNDLDQYESLTELLNSGRKRVLILGAGLIGCELANHLARAGHEVAINDRAPYLLSSVVSEGVSTYVHDRHVQNGIEFLLGTTMNDVAKGDGGLQIRFEDGRTMERDVVISAIGLKPNVDLAARAGLDVGKGINVDDTMRTSDPDIYAVGDCAEHKGQVFSLVECINRQAAVIVDQLCGEGKQSFESRMCIGSITAFLPVGSSCLRPSEPPVSRRSDPSAIRSLRSVVDPIRKVTWRGSFGPEPAQPPLR
ncbi:FAD-dependent oxidoreductase [Thiorhodococcus minor]|uniref:FAD-dependent oxidoreductase n=1 Tax=Thiorhodococcus minor TaxID=57489 RepID=A0A6M0K5Q5_9GAMM|nr:FAD-dependent oxidoreductase [Thiorhodococcus minor]NEV64574.1 FAD-dependent oxidoreductase [Thiorhodococcus minor]